MIKVNKKYKLSQKYIFDDHDLYLISYWSFVAYKKKKKEFLKLSQCTSSYLKLEEGGLKMSIWQRR